MKDKTTIVIPNYNGMKYLQPCMEALQTQGNEAQIILVDNGSSDGSVEYMKTHFPEVKCITFTENKGFCLAVNAGIEEAKTPYVLLLNNDTKVRPYFVEKLEKAMDSHKNAFSVASRMLVMEQPDLLDGAGDLYCALGWAFARYKGRKKESADKSCRIFAACGGAALYRREIFNRIGLFDASHFAYLEDLDMGYRALIHGYENWYEPEAEVLHAGSGFSGSRYNEFKTKLSSRNNVYVIYKNMPLLQIVINVPFLTVGFLVKMFFFMKKGLGKTYVSGFLQGVKGGFQREKKLPKVPFSLSHVGNYCKIQWMLWINMAKRFME